MGAGDVDIERTKDFRTRSREISTKTVPQQSRELARGGSRITIRALMELRSGRRQFPSQQQEQLGADRISALPDDLLLLVLARLRCAAAAARTGVLSRRWCSLWTHLREVVFRGIAFNSLEAALDGISPQVSLLKIHVPRAADTGRVRPQASSIGSLLRAATRLDPEEFVLDLPWGSVPDPVQAELPSFHRATSINSCLFCFKLGVPAGVEFPALETLSLYGCVFDLNTMLSLCPRLRELKLTKFCTHNRDLKVHSVSLQELTVENVLICSIDIVAPSLKNVTMSTSSHIDDLSISILAPMVERVSWQRSLGKIRFGIWCMYRLWLQTARRQGQPTSLHIYAYTSNTSYFSPDTRYCTKAIEQHMIAAFSDLKTHLQSVGHAFGAFVFHLIGLNCIRSAMRRLKVVLGRSWEKEECPTDCLCRPMNWKTKTIALTALEEMEIDGFMGEDHERDFMELVFMSAPMLTRVTVKLSRELSSSSDGCTKLYNIFKVYPFVECCAYLSTGELVSCMDD